MTYSNARTQPCKHCGHSNSWGGRGLCGRCFKTKRIREQYPMLIPTRREPVNGIDAPEELPSPTTALPGTGQKLEELMRRAELGKRLWHPQDGADLS